jgi:hypothetical protein
MDIELIEGYTDPDQATHRKVTFGKRLDGGTLMAIDDDPQSAFPTQFKLLAVRATITAFGTLPMPVPLEVLLKLDAEDIKALIAAHNKFMAEGLGERKTEFVSDSVVKLAFGYEAGGLVYNRWEFGTRLKGYDLVEADKTGFGQLRREYFLIGREIVRLSTDDGKYTLDGSVEIQTVEKLDAEDFVNLRIAALRWRESFRASNRAVQQKPKRRGSAPSS